MPLTPEDIVRKSFNRARFRGYVTAEVDAFLDEVISELQRLTRQVDELRAAQVAGRSGEAEPTWRFQVELEQLEQVRLERAELVRDIVELQDRYDRLRKTVPELERAQPVGTAPTGQS